MGIAPTAKQARMYGGVKRLASSARDLFSSANEINWTTKALRKNPAAIRATILARLGKAVAK